MIGLGTIVNSVSIILGGIIGCLFGNVLKENVRQSLMKVMGLSIIFVGISGVMEKMLVIEKSGIETQGSLMMIISLAIGCLIGEWIDIDQKFICFGRWIREKSGNGQDSRFLVGFVSASLTVCIGAMAIVGAIQDGLYQNPQTLYLKAILDFVIIMLLSASLGKGCAFSSIPVFILQMSVTIIACFLGGFLSDTSINNLSLVGNVLIFCVGVNLIHENTFKVANYLPSLVVAIIYPIISTLF